jgi:ribosome modulation factor
MSKKPSSVKDPKKPKVPAADRSVGNNHNALSEEQHAALVLQACAKIEKLQTAIATATADIRNIRKIAKADGIVPAEINFALFLRKADPDDVVSTARMQDRVAKYLAHPVGTQFGMFEADRTPIADRAFAEGKVAGLEGKDFKSPHDESTEAGQQWMKGWHGGQAVLHAGIRTKAEDVPGHQRRIPAEVDDDVRDEANSEEEAESLVAETDPWSGNSPSRVN